MISRCSKSESHCLFKTLNDAGLLYKGRCNRVTSLNSREMYIGRVWSGSH